MVGIIITESRNSPTTEAKFFIGLKNAAKKYFGEDLCMVREAHHTKPNNLRSEIDGMIRNKNIEKIFVVCDNENDKISKTSEILTKFDENDRQKILFATEKSSPGYTFEHFAGHANTPSRCIVGTDHKSSDDPFEFLGKKHHINFSKKDPKHFKSYLTNLSNDRYVGVIIIHFIKVLTKKHG